MTEMSNAEIDWGQSARLFLKTTWTSGPEGGFSGSAKAEGALSDLVGIHRALSDRDRHRARIVIAGGFHLDGNEIDRLAASEADGTTPWG